MAEEEEIMHSTILRLNTLLSTQALQSFEEVDNIIFSPLVLHTLLSMLSQDLTYYYRNNFKSTLGFYNDNNLYVKCYRDFVLSLQSLNSESISVTNKVFFKDNCKLQNDFKEIVNNFLYETEAINEDFKSIDSWVENQTRSLIKTLISDNNLNNDAHLALLNTVHFKGKWDGTFVSDPNFKTFHLNENEIIETQMMKMTGEVYYNFNEYLSVTTVELPFSSEGFSLMIFLPDMGRNIDRILLWSLAGLAENMTKEIVELSLPKFKIEQLLNCRNIFPGLNLKEEFKDNVYLFDVLQSEEFLNFAQIDEKGFISVDEKGVEAASALATTMVPAELNKMSTSNELKMSEMTIKTVVSNRFSKTLITCKVQNNDKSAREASFTVVLPETAFITEFIMEMNSKIYKSYIKGVEEAKVIYDEALAKGRSAGIVEADTRNSTRFNVSLNLEPQSGAVFFLTYEEMLQRVHDQYEIVLNICPGQIVDNLNVEVNINESRPLKFVKTPSLRSGKEINKKIEAFLTPPSKIEMNSNSSIVKFSADVEQQQKIGCYLGTPLREVFACQFVVQYDVERDPKEGEILLQDGYFVHFFAPNDLDPLPKHVVFVLDTSSSMIGRNLDQLKDAMMSILGDIKKGDLINIIEFNSDVIIWDIESEKCKVISCEEFDNFDEPFGALGKLALPGPTVADDLTINKAKKVVQNMPGEGSTFMIGGLEMALYMTKVGQEKIDERSQYQPIMVFLTDGQPNVGCYSTSHITHLVTKLNLRHNNVPIFSLSFGDGADKTFLRELSLRNFGFSRHIYEASDASLQLQSFYKQISSPLLTDIKFKYESDVTEVTRSHFPIYFKGGELVVSGRCKGCQLPNTINGCGPGGYLNLGSILKNPVTSLERLWAYLTVKQLLEERKTVDDNVELTKRAVELALKYSFVTEVTSLVVVKPDEICDTNASEGDSYGQILDNRGGVSDGTIKKKVIKKRVIKKCINRNRQEPEEIVSVEELPEDIEIVEQLPEEPKKLEIVADHPFFIAITLKRGNERIFLFVGKVSKPSC